MSDAKTHHAIATELEDRAGKLLEVVVVGHGHRPRTGKAIAEAHALATLALSHRIAAQTEALHRTGRR
jgi:hypothetical protein